MKAAGSVPLTYQWQHNGADIPGATHSSLLIPSAGSADAGTYSVTISNSTKSISAGPVTLAVLPAPAYINLTNSLVLHLKFDGTVTDSSGRGNNGTMVVRRVISVANWARACTTTPTIAIQPT